MGGYVQPHIVIVWEIKIEERGRGGGMISLEGGAVVNIIYRRKGYL